MYWAPDIYWFRSSRCVKSLRVVCCGQPCELPSLIDLRGLLSFWLLWEVRRGPKTGAEISERLAWRRGSPVSPGTLYPALAALEKEGAVAKAMKGRDSEYRITARGRSELECAVGCLRAMMRDVVLEGL